MHLYIYRKFWNALWFYSTSGLESASWALHWRLGCSICGCTLSVISLLSVLQLLTRCRMCCLHVLQAGNWTLRTVNNATDAFVAIAGLANAFPAPAETSEPNKGATKLGIQPSKGFDQPKLNPELLNAGFVLGQACINSYSTSGQLGVALPTGWSECHTVLQQ